MFIRSFAPPSLCRTLSDTVDVCFHPTGQVFWLSRVSPCRTVEYISIIYNIYIYIGRERGGGREGRKGPGKVLHSTGIDFDGLLRPIFPDGKLPSTRKSFSRAGARVAASVGVVFLFHAPCPSRVSARNEGVPVVVGEK